MKNSVVKVNIDTKQQELTDRLKHYNDWLMDKNRNFTEVYPGFPGDGVKKGESKVKVVPTNPSKKGKSVMSIKTVGVKVARSTVNKAPKAGSKQAIANEIVQRIGVEEKAKAIEVIMSEAKMSKAGATTYFHNARHFLARSQQAQ